MSWKTIVVCEPCYQRRRDTDDQLIDNPTKMIGYTTPCADCGGDACIPIRSSVRGQHSDA